MTTIKIIFGDAGCQINLRGGGRGTGKAYPPRGWVRGIVNNEVVNLLRKTADGLSAADNHAATLLVCCPIAIISKRQSAVRYFVRNDLLLFTPMYVNC